MKNIFWGQTLENIKTLKGYQKNNMKWDETIVTGAIGLGIGIIVAGKTLKEFGSFGVEDKDIQLNKSWRL